MQYVLILTLLTTPEKKENSQTNWSVNRKHGRRYFRIWDQMWQCLTVCEIWCCYMWKDGCDVFKWLTSLFCVIATPGNVDLWYDCIRKNIMRQEMQRKGHRLRWARCFSRPDKIECGRYTSSLVIELWTLFTTWSLFPDQPPTRINSYSQCREYYVRDHLMCVHQSWND